MLFYDWGAFSIFHLTFIIVIWAASLCNLCVLGDSVVSGFFEAIPPQRRREHRDCTEAEGLFRQTPLEAIQLEGL